MNVLRKFHLEDREYGGWVILRWALRRYVVKMEIDCENGIGMELAWSRVQWRTLVISILNIRVLQPQY